MGNFTLNWAEPYNDIKMRNGMIDAFIQIYGEEYVFGSKHIVKGIEVDGIDLVLKSNPIYGIEGERNGWNGDFWEHIGKRNVFKLKYSDYDFDFEWDEYYIFTLNAPARKGHYWNLNYLTDKHPFWDGEFDKGWDGNKFARINFEFDQLCVIEPDVFLDPKKRIFVPDRPVSNSKVPEDWFCFPKPYVKTYNKQKNGIWLPSTHPDGLYRGPSQKDIAEYQKLRVIEVMKNIKN